MGVMPVTKVGRIEFCEAHVGPFGVNHAAIGTTSTAVTDLQTKTVAARAAFNAQQAAQNAAKAATNSLRIAMLALTDATADVIKQIKTQAAIVGDSVYSLSEIPAPATPGPVGAPGKPEAFKVVLQPNGSLKIGWSCANPVGCHGVIYQIWRKVDATEAYQYLGGAGKREFVDTTVPSGVPSVMYQVQGTRTTSVGVANDFMVNFGVGVSGIVTASVTEGLPAKIAA